MCTALYFQLQSVRFAQVRLVIYCVYMKQFTTVAGHSNTLFYKNPPTQSSLHLEDAVMSFIEDAKLQSSL